MHVHYEAVVSLDCLDHLKPCLFFFGSEGEAAFFGLEADLAALDLAGCEPLFGVFFRDLYKQTLLVIQVPYSCYRTGKMLKTYRVQ